MIGRYEGLREVETVKQLTVRGVDEELEAALAREARRRDKSMSATVLELLRERVGLAPTNAGQVGRELDDFIGMWSAEEARAFNEELLRTRVIDPELFE
jgi:plasmid stability protein